MAAYRLLLLALQAFWLNIGSGLNDIETYGSRAEVMRHTTKGLQVEHSI